MKINEKAILKIIKNNQHDKCNLLAILTEVQTEYNWLPPQALRIIADELSMPLIDIYGVASFYHAFSLVPRGKHVITVCSGTACHVRGAPYILNRIRDRLDIEPGCTTKDEQFTLETVNCLGACALAPVVVIDGEYHGQATVQKIDALLLRYLKNSPTPKPRGQQKKHSTLRRPTKDQASRMAKEKSLRKTKHTTSRKRAAARGKKRSR
jgi:NADH-quinone oxidoreductase subunit E